MSSHSEHFECRWLASRWLLIAYAGLQAVAAACLFQLSLPVAVVVALCMLCLAHASWVLPRHILLSHEAAYCGLRWTDKGWWVYNHSEGWQPIELHPDSLALPLIVLLRFRLTGQRRVRALCVPRDSLPRRLHRQLRVRLKFSRYRWAAAE
ncbi:protein YgfX [Pseudomonas sp. TTU2014-080ASC]|uniref:protein YgfX n=1 Tax=Pseudomonas sp. TTU2014-080ASC TaxID=1729724 RepID=UPI0007189EF4|nr:protein YgfX [Pseudomonas sp. TTU2014-080ASC]KRW59436.1 hypothetical protein AO726_11505 [Pseudomonas sp. TTU2014-080ASC]